MSKKSISFESLSNVLTPLTHLINKKADKIALNDKAEKSAIITKLSEMIEDSDHRTVSDSNIDAWNNKSEFSGAYEDLSNLPSFSNVAYSGSYNDLDDIIVGNTFVNDNMTISGIIPSELHYIPEGYIFEARDYTVDFTVKYSSSSKTYTKTMYFSKRDALNKYIYYKDTLQGSSNVAIFAYDDGRIQYTPTGSVLSADLVFHDVKKRGVLPLDTTYLPTTVPVIPSAQVGQLIAVKAVDENSKPTEWETADIPTNVSELTNDTGYITAEEVPEGFSGSYNDLTDKPSIPSSWSDFGDREMEYLYHGTIVIENGTAEITGLSCPDNGVEVAVILTSEDGNAIYDSAMTYVYNSMANVSEYRYVSGHKVFDKIDCTSVTRIGMGSEMDDGNWILEIYDPNQDRINEIPSQYIPSTIARVEDIPDPIQADYAQNDPEQPDYIKNRLAYSTREQVAHESVTIGIYNLGYATLPYEFFPGNGEEYAINWDGTDYTATAAITTVDDEEVLVIGNTSFFGGSTNTDNPFGIISRSGRALVYSSESGEHTISLTGYEQIPHKIPREYVDHNPIVGVIDSSYYNYRYLNPAKGASIAEVRQAAVEGNRDIIIRLDLDNWQGTLRYMGLTNVSTDGTNYVSAMLFSTIKANNVSINDSDEAIDGTMQLEYWYALLEPTEGPPADAFVNFQFAEINLAPGTAKAGYYMRVNEKGLWEATEGISNVSELTNDAGYISAPATASVGQTIIVKSVDENGKPTEWESADMASGSGLPEGATAHQQLVTDAEGNAKWEDKLCYEGLTEIIHQQTITCEQETSDIYCGAVDGHLTTDMVGKTYKVRFNGVEYECEAVNMGGTDGVFMGNMSLIGIPNSDTGEPFILADQGNCICLVTESGKYDICIIGSEVKIIDSKYLPSMSYAPYTEWETAVMVAGNTPPLSPGTILNWNNGVMLVYGVEENSFYAYKFSANMRCKYTIGDDGKWNESLREYVE